MGLPAELANLNIELRDGNQILFEHSATYKLWPQIFPNLSLAHVVKTISSALPENTQNKLLLDIIENGRLLLIEVSAIDKTTSDTIISAVRVLTPAGHLRLQETNISRNGGTGISRDLFKAFLNAFADLPLNKLVVQATRIGSYAHAKFGFTPGNDDWVSLKEKIKNERLPAIKNLITPEANKLIEAILASDDPRGIWALAHLDIKISLPKKYPVLGGEKTTLGKALLIGQNWNGRIDLNDDAAVAIFNEYILNAPRKAVSPEIISATKDLYFNAPREI